MKTWITRLLLALLLLAAGAWAWISFHPSPERAVQNRLLKLARAVSVDPGEGQLARLSRAQSLANFFTPDVEVTVDVPGYHSQSLQGRDELLQAALAARSRGTLKVQVVDVHVRVMPDGHSAEAHFTGEARSGSDQGLQAQELRAQFVKVDGEWLIRHVETVRTLR